MEWRDERSYELHLITHGKIKVSDSRLWRSRSLASQDMPCCGVRLVFWHLVSSTLQQHMATCNAIGWRVWIRCVNVCVVKTACCHAYRYDNISTTWMWKDVLPTFHDWSKYWWNIRHNLDMMLFVGTYTTAVPSFAIRVSYMRHCFWVICDYGTTPFHTNVMILA